MPDGQHKVHDRSVSLSFATVAFLGIWVIFYGVAAMIGEVKIASNVSISLPNTHSLFAIPAGLLLLQDCFRNKA